MAMLQQITRSHSSQPEIIADLLEQKEISPLTRQLTHEMTRQMKNVRESYVIQIRYGVSCFYFTTTGLPAIGEKYQGSPGHDPTPLWPTRDLLATVASVPHQTNLSENSPPEQLIWVPWNSWFLWCAAARTAAVTAHSRARRAFIQSVFDSTTDDIYEGLRQDRLFCW